MVCVTRRAACNLTVIAYSSLLQMQGGAYRSLPCAHALAPPSYHRPPTAVELLRSFAYARGWVAASGLPDETRAGRRILKDYVDGKILYCKAPPGASPEVLALAAAAGRRQRASGAAAAAGAAAPPAHQQQQQQDEDGEHHEGPAQQGAPAADAGQAVEAAASSSAAGSGEGAAPQGDPGVVLDLDEGDLLLMDDLDIGGRKSKAQRPAYKVRGCGGQGRPLCCEACWAGRGSGEAADLRVIRRARLSALLWLDERLSFTVIAPTPSLTCSSTRRRYAARATAGRRRSSGPCTMGHKLCRCGVGGKRRGGCEASVQVCIRVVSPPKLCNKQEPIAVSLAILTIVCCHPSTCRVSAAEWCASQAKQHGGWTQSAALFPAILLAPIVL